MTFCVMKFEMAGRMRRTVFRSQAEARLDGTVDEVWQGLLRSLHLNEGAMGVREDGLKAMTARILQLRIEAGSPIIEVQQRSGDRWSPLIMGILRTGVYRHAELLRVVNALSDISGFTHISQKILTLKLRGLERDGFIERKVWPVMPPRTDYWLTPLGVSFQKQLNSTLDWAMRHSEEILEAQRRYDAWEQ